MRMIALLALLAAPLAAQSLGERFLAAEDAAMQHFDRRDWAKAIAAFEAQIALYADNPRPYYNIACAYALQGDAPRAATWLSRAIEHGWRDAEWLAADKDFERVRASEQFAKCLAELRAARERDPDPAPRDLPRDEIEPAADAREILTAAAIRLRLLLPQEALRGEHDFRKRLFRIYDERRARLTRYLEEHGDARDADLAALERLRTSLRYADAATEDRASDRLVRAAAARLADADAALFLRRFPGSPLLPRVLYLRADTAPELRALLRDHPDFDGANQARVDLVRLLRGSELRAAFEELEERARTDGDLAGRMRASLMEARLRVKGMPDLGVKGTLYLCVSVRDPRTLPRLAALKKFKPVIVCLDRAADVPDVALDAWLKQHAEGCAVIRRGSGAIERLWLNHIPTVILARADGTVLAVDPSDAEVAKELGK